MATDAAIPAATIDPHGLDAADPRSELPTIEREFPGVTRWFELRRRAARMRENGALDRLAELPAGAAIDIPIAGADWPYGRALDADQLIGAAAAQGFTDQQWRVRSMHEPPGTVLRVRIDPTSNAHKFVGSVCAHAREIERQHREIHPSASLAALCAYFAGRDMGTRWMGAMSAAGLMRTAPPDAVATAMAAYAATIVMDLPGHETDTVLGERHLDILLTHAYTSATEQGRARLDAAETTIIDIDPRLALLAPLATPGPAGDHWRVGGIGTDATPTARRAEVIDALTDLESRLPTAPPVRTAARRGDEHFMARIGHALALSLSRTPEGANVEELALALVSEHGLAAGHDRRVRRYAASIGTAANDHAYDLRLAVDRLAAIDGDPCRASLIAAAIDAQKSHLDRAHV